MAAIVKFPTNMGRRLKHIIGDAFGAEVVEYNLEKALKEVRERIAAPNSTFYDPMSLFMGREWLTRRNGALSPFDLRRMAMNPIIGSIINTRVAQVAAYCQPQASAYDFGYKITSEDPDAKKDTTRARDISDWFLTAGLEGYGEKHLNIFVRKYIYDSLVMDAAAGEVVLRRNGEPAYVVAVDAATIKFLKGALNYAIPHRPNEPIFAQVIDDIITCQYTAMQMMYMIRNPQTDLGYAGYGLPELEILMRTVTTIINTDRFNSAQLAQGGTNKGILIVKGDGVEKYEMENFRRDFREAVRNAASFWRPPVLQIGKEADVEWVALDRSNRDMEYGALFDFLVKQACLDGRSKITMADGTRRRIDGLVREGGEKYVLSMTKDGRVEPKKVLRFLKNDVRTDMIEISYRGLSHKGHSENKLRVTSDHKILVLDGPGKWKPAGELIPGDRVAIVNSRAMNPLQEQILRGSLLGDSCDYKTSAGYRPYDEGGDWSEGTIIRTDIISVPTRTYCLEVEDNHNFFAEGILVSNCGVYQISPEEVNWSIGSQSARTNFESSQAPKIRASQIKGLKPILATLANTLNLHLTKRFDPRYRLEFVGMLETRQEDAAIREKEVTSYKQLNEARADLGLDPVPYGDLILNREYIEYRMAREGLTKKAQSEQTTTNTPGAPRRVRIQEAA